MFILNFKSPVNQVALVIFRSLIVIGVDGSLFFHNGRVRGGNLQLHVESKLGNAQKNVVTRWINQRLDHSDVENLATWQQRYYVNDELFDQEKRNVAFLLIGGEGEATDDWMSTGDWFDKANQSSALMFQLEHRFYGESHPTEDLSVENLRYLTSEQALADLAKFVDAMNNEYRLSKEVKWIAFGGSYSGSLAAWARLKYPRLIHGAVSTSAPLLAIPNFKDFLPAIANDLNNIDEKCYSAVKLGTDQIGSFLQNLEGQRNFSALFQLCRPLEEYVEDEDNISNLYFNLAANFGVIALHNKVNRLYGRGTLLRNISLDTLCSIMTNTSIGLEIDRLAEVNSLLLQAFYQGCFGFNYKNMVEQLKDVSWEMSQGGRQWAFQSCNEFGLYQTSDKMPKIFGDKLPLDYYVKQCMDVFGSKFDGKYLDYATRRTNRIYGGYNITVSNIVFVHGSVDPWHTLGSTSTKNQKAPVILITGTAHCANMFPPSEDDPPQLTAARAQIGHLIQSWLK